MILISNFEYFSLEGRPRRDRTEMHKELFLKKRSRKGLLSGPVKSNLLDFDFNLEPIESEESGSSGDETYLVPSSKAMAKSKSNKQTMAEFTYPLTRP